MRRLLLLALLLAAPAQAQAPGEGFEVERYTVALRPDLTTTAIAGTQTITLRATAATTRLAFSPNALAITAAAANGAPVAASTTPEAITFTLPQALRPGQRLTLAFHFAGTPRRGVTATPAALATGYFACDWMICLQDSPGDKAHVQLDLILPAGLDSLGPGRATITPLPGKLARHRWRTTRPMSPYLYAFAAGRFPRHTERTAAGTLTYLDGTAASADLPHRFAQSPAIAAFLADKAGLPLPDRSYTQLLVPGEEAQETAGFSLIGQAELDAEAADPTTAWIVTHEMAHAWWGNLVTCASWRDFWLNEGLATFMVAAWQEHAHGPAAYQAELANARRRVERVRAQGYDKPLAWPGKYPTLGARRAVQYCKGALFLAHLREQLGDAAFWAGIRSYTRRHAGGTVTSADFQRAMQQATPRDLAPLFAEWVGP